MAPRIVSWSDREIYISPVLSSAASIISFDSTFSDPIPTYSQMSPTASEAPGLPGDEFGARHSSLPVFSEEGRTPKGGHATLDDSFVRHDAYFFKDGNVTFLIDGTLYCVHRYFFSRDSAYFSTRFAQLGIRDHEALPIVISIGDVKRNDFEALLSILYPANFEAHELSYEQWKSVLHLSTRWDFASLRKLALKFIRSPTSHDQLVLARTYSVDQWVLPALTALCSRSLPLSLDEARQMDIEDVILVAAVREEIRGGALRVDVADIPRCVEAAQAETLNRPVGDKIYWTFNPKVKTEDAKMVISPLGPQHRDTTEGYTDESEVERLLKGVPTEPPGVGQPRVMEGGTPHDCRKNATTPAVQARGAQKFEDTLPGAAAWPLSGAMLAENHAVRDTVRQEAEAKMETMHHLEAQAAKECADAEERARKVQEETAPVKEMAVTVAMKATKEAEAKAKRVAARAEAAAIAEAEAVAKACEEAKAQKTKKTKRREAVARAKAEEAVAKAKAEEAEAKKMKKRGAAARAKAEAEAKATREAEAKAQAEAKAKKEREAHAKTKAEAEVRAKAEADAWEMEKQEAEAKAKAEAHSRGTEEANMVKTSWTKAAAAKEELELDQQVEKPEERLEAEAEEERAEAEKEVRKRAKAEELCEKQAGEQIAKQRTTDKATRANVSDLAATSPVPPFFGNGSLASWASWFVAQNQLTQVTASEIAPTEGSSPPPRFGLCGTDPWSKNPGSSGGGSASGLSEVSQGASDSEAALPAAKPSGMGR